MLRPPVECATVLRGWLRTAILVLAACLGASAVLAAPAAATPRPGLWLGAKGAVQISFTVNRVRGRLYVANAVTICRGSGNADLPDGMRDQLGKLHRYPIERDGRVPTWPYDLRPELVRGQYRQVRPWPAPRLGTSSGTVSALQLGGYTSDDPRCAPAESRDVRVRRVPARPVRDGEYHGLGNYQGGDQEAFEYGPDVVVTVYGGGVLAVLTPGRVGGTGFAEPGGKPGDYCLMPEWSRQSAPLAPDGSFAVDGVTKRDFTVGDNPTDVPFSFRGRFTTPTEASGTYSAANLRCGGILDRRGLALTESFVARPYKLYRDGAPVGRGGRRPGPPATTPTEPKPPAAQPYPGAPAPSGAAGCTAKASAGPLEGVASCWRRRGDVWVSDGRARINGIDVTPARDGIAIRLHPASYRVSSSGPVEVRVGSVRLYRGTVDWLARRPIAFSIKGRSAAKDPGGKFDPSDQKLFGLPVGGSAELSMDDGKTALKIGVEIPKTPAFRVLRNFAGWSGDLTAAATNDAGLVLSGATVKLPSAGTGFIDVENATLAIARVGSGAYHFDGSATVYPFKTSGIGILGQLGFGPGDGYFKLGGGVEQLNRPLVYGFLIQKLFFALQVNPFGLAGAAGVTFGPQFRLSDRLVSTARLDGGFSYLSASGEDPSALELTGELAIAGEARVADAKVRVAGAKIDVEGNANWTLASYGITGAMKGWFDGTRAFDLDGRVNVSLPGPDHGGDGVMSSRGIGACRRGVGPDVGFGYRWGQGLGGLDAFASSCDLGPWREARTASAAQAGARTVRVPRRTRTVVLAAVGTSAAPQVAFVAPNGRRYQPSAAPEGLVATSRVLLVVDPVTRATYLAVDRPAAGRWRIELLPGSPPVGRVRVAWSTGRLRVRARVRPAGGSRRVLRYRLANRNGARVTFVEQARTARRTLGSTRRSRGSIGFRPTPGPGGRRRILALVERGGHPTGVVRPAASFRTGRVRLAPPRAIRVRRVRGFDRRVTWRGPRRAAYQVDVRTGDGRRLRYRRPGTRRRVVVDHVPARVRMRVSIVARTPASTSRTVTRRFG